MDESAKRVDIKSNDFIKTNVCGCNLTQWLEDPAFYTLKGPKGEPGIPGQDGLVSFEINFKKQQLIIK